VIFSEAKSLARIDLDVCKFVFIVEFCMKPCKKATGKNPYESITYEG
jgi:hypothetical protein